MYKKCARCGKIKLTVFFSKDNKRKDKLDPYCKKCNKERNDKRRIENYAHVLEIEKKNREKNHSNIIEQGKRYAKTEKGKKVRKDYYKNNPEKRIARGAVNTAVAYGQLPQVKTLICNVCNTNQASHYHHHNGYSPEHYLDVIPVCIGCHKNLDYK